MGLDIKSPVGPTIIRTEKKISVSSTSTLLEKTFTKAIAAFCLLYLISLTFTYVIFTRISTMNILKAFFRKTGILVETTKITYLNYAQKRECF